MTPERRKEIAQKAAKARWAKEKAVNCGRTRLIRLWTQGRLALPCISG
jgi:hypothetical protein